MIMKSYTVLIIEDEVTINRLVTSYFKNSGYKVLSAINGIEGLDLFNSNKIDVVCLDIMMPKMNGWDVASAIRKQSDVPIIMMSALSEEEDILKGYSLRVDDYITKPFNPKVLIAKIENLMRRIDTRRHLEDQNILHVKGVRVDLNTHRTYVDDKEITLTKTEFDLLVYLIRNEGMICSRNHLLDKVWGTDVFVEDRIVDTYVKKIRKHLGPYAYYIKTVFGVGYRFETIDA